MTVGYIEYDQWRLVNAKLRVDLFDERFAVYEMPLDVSREALRKKGWPVDANAGFQRQIDERLQRKSERL